MQEAQACAGPQARDHLCGKEARWRPFGADCCWSPERPAAGTAAHQGATSAAVQPATPLLPQAWPLFIASPLDSVQLSLGTSYCYVNTRCNTY